MHSDSSKCTFFVPSTTNSISKYFLSQNQILMGLKIRSQQWPEKHHYLFSPPDSYFPSLLLPLSVSSPTLP
ncbi:hypothetical protein E1A91_D08G081200v1 [Gossypium mustelinum]|uniref:Uncharacterized protein n=1 Tax=Gossypium mustelinum TaxID=34275 RepID=A0A5D2TTA3_GOSMU|nr:hypothetical protein E1A91_D08G081200v1 [Gossypium mustelinum]